MKAGEAKIRVGRHEPGKGFYYREYRVKIGKRTTVLDALTEMVEERDPTLAVGWAYAGAVGWL